MEPSIRDEYQHMSTFFYFIVTTKGDLHEIENINYFFFLLRYKQKLRIQDYQ